MGVREPADATETAIIVPVPAAEAAVGPYRRVLDPSASWGVPAHVTVLYPFVPPDSITENVIEDVRTCLATVDAFACTFARVEWFRRDVVWLAPDPDEPFRTLTERVWRQFPRYPPYAGAYAELIPHLTVGSTGGSAGGSAGTGDIAAMERAATDIRATLPIQAQVDRVLLIAGTDAPDSWHPVAEFPLRPA